MQALLKRKKVILKKINNISYADFIATSQVKMALETEDYELDYNTVLKGVTSVIENPVKGNYYIVFINDEPVSCLLTVPEWSDWRNKTVLWIHSVYVDESYREQGVYKYMYKCLSEFVESDDSYAGIRLYVDKRNIKALKVYSSLGMESEHYSLCEWLK